MKRKKNAREKRVLIGAVAVAGVMVAGSTFAWFTSKDEVTNRLSAVGEYGVAIAEDFTPPDEWVPGQTVKKEAKAINTGNVDAFVRMWLTGNMNIITDDGGVGIDTFKGYSLTSSGLGGNYTMKKSDADEYYRVLSENERKALQTGDLVYADDEYSFTSNITGAEQSFPAHNTYGSINSVDSDSFKPQGTGLYIFRRLINDVGSGSVNTEYSGYYCIKDGEEIKCYALVTKPTGDVKNVYIEGLTNKIETALVDAIKGIEATGDTSAVPSVIKIRKATKSTVTDAGLTWTFTEPANAAASPFGNMNPYYVVSLKTPGENQSTIKINVELENLGDGTKPDKWQRINKTGQTDTFYYTDDLEAAELTVPLVANVNLDNGVAAGSYVAFDFDLNVNLESVQIVKDTTEVEITTPVSGAGNWAPTDGTTSAGASGAAKNADKEIETIKWTALS